MTNIENTKNSNFTNNLSLIDDEDGDEEDPYISNLWETHRRLDRLRGKMSLQQIPTIEPTSEDLLSDNNDDDTILPPTYLIIEIVSNIKENALNWLIDKIIGKRCNGGGELIVMRQPNNPKDAFILHIAATKIKFLEIAEEMEIIKEDKFGVMREFVVSQLDDFLLINNNNNPNSGDNIDKPRNIDNFLTDGEKQSIVLHELENIRALTEEHHIPGYIQEKLYEGQSIIQACIQANLITKIYPLHDDDYIKKISKKWYCSLFAKQPFEEIRSYFGESITLYFVFLDYYTNALIIPVILGFLQLFFSYETLPFFCVFNVVWVTLFLEMWKRKSNEYAYRWGTISMTSLDEPRPNFHGPMGYDAVSGKLQPQSPRYRTTLKMYLVSTPIVLLCMIGAFIMMLVSFWTEDYIKMNYPNDEIVLNLPSIIYTILVYIVNLYYRQLATYLTEWENHRTQSQYDRHRVTKLVLFEFVNNFMALFYIAFVIQDMEMLKGQLKIMLIIQQVINNIQEAILPLIMNYIEIKMKQWRNSKKYELVADSEDDGLPKICNKLPKITKTDSRLDDVNKQNDLIIYEGTYDDYLELFIQFGYVFLFSSIYPLSTLWALINNLIEIRCDAFKLCKIYQRPIKRRCKDIGAWQKWFEILNTISIITNCGLLCLCPQLRQNYQENYIDQIVWILLFVLLEHLLLSIRYILHIAISDKPEWVRVELAKRNYESKQALKFERAQRNRHFLKRKFKTVHGTHA